jgi:hypothetical protein
MSAPERSRIAEAVPPASPDPAGDGPGRNDTDEGIDLQAIRLTVVTARPIVDRLLDGEWQTGEWSGGASVLDQALDGLAKAMDEVERLQHEVATREAAARHALDAATKARQKAESLRAELEQALDQRAAAYLGEVQCWDLLSRAAEYLPDNVLADPEAPNLDHALRQLRHDVATQLQSDPSKVARALWEELLAARETVTAAEGIPDLLGEGNFNAAAIDQAKARLTLALAAHRQTKAGATDG